MLRTLFQLAGFFILGFSSFTEDHVRYYICYSIKQTATRQQATGWAVLASSEFNYNSTYERPVLLVNPTYIPSFDGFIVSCYGLNKNVKPNTVRLKFTETIRIDTILLNILKMYRTLLPLRYLICLELLIIRNRIAVFR